MYQGEERFELDDDSNRGKCFERQDYTIERLVGNRSSHRESFEASQTSVFPRMFEDGWGRMSKVADQSS